MTYFYKIKKGEKIFQKGENVSFDPASISKLFYASYIIKKINKEEKIKLQLNDFNKYNYGTIVLEKRDVDKSFSIKELLEYMICDSCNISTGLIADYAGRENINKYIKEDLCLKNSSIKSDKTDNITTLNDLARFYEQVDKDLLDLMLKNRRKSSIKKTLGKDLAFKGGTTISGDRRELAIYPEGYIIIVQKVYCPFNRVKQVLFNSKVKKLLSSLMNL